MIKFLTSIKSETAVGLLILAGIALMIYASIRVTGWNIDKKDVYRVSANLDNVTGLSFGTAVRMAGVEVGQIDSITLENGKAKVIMIIYKKYALRQDTKLAVKSLGILGDKYLEVTPGTDGFNTLDDNDQIVLIQRGSDLDSLIDNLAYVLEDIRSVTGALNESLGGKKGSGKINRIMDNIEGLTYSLKEITDKTNANIDTILKNVAGFSENLNQITGENREGIKVILDNIRVVSTELREVMTENRQNILAITENLSNVSNDLNSKTPGITDSLQKSLAELEKASKKIDTSFENIASITQKIDSGEGTVAQLINEKETVTKLNQALDDLGGFLGKANKLKFDIDFHTEYFNRYKDFKSNLGLNIYPSRYHSFSIQLIDDPQGKRSSKTVITTEKDNSGKETTKEENITTIDADYKLSLLIAQRYFDTRFSAGLIESSFGAGVEQFFGKNDDYNVYFNAFDLSRKDEPNPHFKFGIVWRFYANFYLTAGADDFASKFDSKKNYFLGFGLGFNEDNLKYLAASAGALTPLQ